MLFSIWMWIAHAASPVVAMGDGLVVAPPSAEVAVPASLGWVPVLADCLEERSPGNFQMIDRVVPGETVQTALARVTTVLDLSPSVVIVGLGARELGVQTPDPGAFERGILILLEGLLPPDASGRVVVLLGVVPSRSAAENREDASAVEAWNGRLARLARARSSVHFVDLWSGWPQAGQRLPVLHAADHELSPAGHAQVASQVCEVVLGLSPEAKETRSTATVPE